ncbi:MAG TPA: VOC family protein [Jatrophihabitans sp.]|nr:VOC family protein [Jatrophihabitans sp.]
MTGSTARLSSVVFDCPDPQLLARFYQDLLGYRLQQADDDWVSIAGDDGHRLSFQRISNYQAPTWPVGRRPQQVHLDLVVDDLAAAHDRALAAGASPLGAVAVHSDESFQVYADPAGHPFCLIQQAEK